MISEKLQFPLRDAWPFPVAPERAAWLAAAERKELKPFWQEIFQEAEEALTSPIPEENVTLAMEFIKTGNRDHFELNYFRRRQHLEALVLAECAEYRGRFLPRIADYLWAITGEHFWAVPAHLPYDGGDPLPAPDVPMVDLFCAETAMLLACTLRLLAKELAAVSENLVKTVRRNILKRAIEPLENPEMDFWWYQGANNWTPWCCSNLLGAVLCTLSDQPERQEKVVRFLAACCDRYLERYADDGGCDEGPGYWCVSPGVLLVFLEQLYLASDRKIDLFGEPKIRRMGEYIANCHLANGYYASFSDSCPRNPGLPTGVIYRYGERIDSPEMREFALQAAAGFRQQEVWEVRRDFCVKIYNTLLLLFAQPPRSPKPPADHTVYYPDTQHLFIRSGRLALAAKAGHNEENHNHNDIGQFILLADGEPAIIDPSRTEYTRFTFSDRRYENWIINSSGHNVPAFDGIGQQYGREYAASEVKFDDDGVIAQFRMELSGAYPAELRLESCIRTLRFDRRNGTVHLCDEWRSSVPHCCRIPFLTHLPVQRRQDGAFQLGSLKMTVRSGEAELQEFPADDLCLRANWGPLLRRLTVTAAAGTAGCCEVFFSLI